MAATRSSVDANAGDTCPPHHWVCTEVRIDNISYTRMECKKCQTRKDVEKPNPYRTTRPWKLTKPPRSDVS